MISIDIDTGERTELKISRATGKYRYNVKISSVEETIEFLTVEAELESLLAWIQNPDNAIHCLARINLEHGIWFQLLFDHVKVSTYDNEIEMFLTHIDYGQFKLELYKLLNA